MGAAAAKTRRPRRPRVRLQPTRIVTTAMDIAQERGLEAVSMRSLAAALGVEAMSLYHHVANKAALLGLMAERSASQLPRPDPAFSPEQQLMQLSLAMYGAGVANPAFLQAVAAGRLPSITGAETTEVTGLSSLSSQLLLLLQDCGVPEPEVERGGRAVIAVVVGNAFITLSERRPRAEVDPVNIASPREGQRESELQLTIGSLVDALRHPAAGVSMQ